MNADPITGGGTDDGSDDDGVDPITGEDPDGTMETATDLGTFDPLTQSGKVGFTEDGVKDASDYYKFTVAETDDVQIILDGMRQNANLELLDSSGSVIVDSSSSGSNSEVINHTLDSGDYYLKVYAAGSAQTDYTVQFF
jgi:hypothetical protein